MRVSLRLDLHCVPTLLIRNATDEEEEIDELEEELDELDEDQGSYEGFDGK